LELVDTDEFSTVKHGVRLVSYGSTDILRPGKEDFKSRPRGEVIKGQRHGCATGLWGMARRHVSRRRNDMYSYSRKKGRDRKIFCRWAYKDGRKQGTENRFSSEDYSFLLAKLRQQRGEDRKLMRKRSLFKTGY